MLLNPIVDSDCSGLESGKNPKTVTPVNTIADSLLDIDTYHCVSAPGVVAPIATGTTSAIASATSSTVSVPGPTQTGIPVNCNAYYVVQCEFTYMWAGW